MTSSRPYLIRAIHEWIIENNLTPYLLVNAKLPGVEVPINHIENDKIILNLSPRAVRTLRLGNDFIQFDARFNGLSTNISIPPAAVMAIYARENGQGMIFDKEDGVDPPNSPPTKPEGPVKPKLSIVK